MAKLAAIGLIAIALAFALSTTYSSERLAMASEQTAPPLQLSPLAVPGGGRIDTLSLRQSPDGAVHLLLSSRDGAGPVMIHLYGADLATAPRLLGTYKPPQLFPPQWAATELTGALLAVALTRPGSAASPLVQWRSDQTGVTAMSTTDILRVFGAPRALRNVDGPPLFSAVERRAGKGIATLFRQDGSGDWSERILHAAASLDEAMLVPAGKGWLLLYKIADGGGASEALRTRPHGPVDRTTLGRLQGLRLDAQFEAVGAEFALPGLGPVYEFDADLMADRLVVLGTTPSGYSMLEARFTDISIDAQAHSETVLAAACGAPSVLLNGGMLHIALLDGIGSAAAQLVYGQR